MNGLAECLPRVLPQDWKILSLFGDGYTCQCRDGLRVICSTAPMEDGREWLHVSMSRENMKYVKQTFCPDRYAYQVFPPPDKHINIHQFCLHLWVPLTGELPLPDFTMGGNSI